MFKISYNIPELIGYLSDFQLESSWGESIRKFHVTECLTVGLHCFQSALPKGISWFTFGLLQTLSSKKDKGTRCPHMGIGGMLVERFSFVRIE